MFWLICVHVISCTWKPLWVQVACTLVTVRAICRALINGQRRVNIFAVQNDLYYCFLEVYVLEFTKDKCLLFLFFLSFFSGKLFKEVNKCENHTQRHWISNKGKKIIFHFVLFSCFRMFFSTLFVHFYFLCKWSSLFLFSSFHWTVFVVFNLFESYLLALSI